MFFKTFVDKEKNSDLNMITKDLLDMVEEKIKTEENFEQKNILKDIKEILKNTKTNGNASRYGINKISFADSELIEAIDREEQAVEYLIYRYKFKSYPLNHKLTDFPLVLAIEPSSRCNLRCKMCFQSSEKFKLSNQNNSIMDMDTYNSIMNELDNNTLYSIVFASRGEPLINPNICNMIKKAKKKNVFDIKLNTNAALLNKELSRNLIQSGLDLIVFSIDSIIPEHYKNIRGIELEKVLKNIDEFIEIKKSEFPDSKLKTRVSMVITNEYKEEFENEVNKAKEYWLNRVDELAIKSENDFIHIYDEGKEIDELNICNLLWERLYIWNNGDVNPCDIDHLSTLKFGNINNGTTIKEIWNSNKLKSLREEHLNNRDNMKCVCRNCKGY
ncbi:MAG: radical SAM protein [Clostridia bacterium]|nr:radical SAM protein [Clostridia bacterium]